jgi:hypothetical protein
MVINRSLFSGESDFLERISAGVELLVEAHFCACHAERDRWQFAVEVDDLHSLGLSKNSLRWLVHKGYAEHALELTPGQAVARVFRRTASLKFSAASCFVLSDAGVDFAASLSTGQCYLPPTAEVFADVRQQIAMDGDALAPPAPPQWDKHARILRVGEQVVKHFRVPASNQELILSAFQEEGWPPSIDDPLPPAPEIDAKRRLHDAINRLNGNQKVRLLVFKGNGNGRGVYWTHATESASRR